MQEKLRQLLTKVEYDFLLNHKPEYINRAAKSWEHTLLKTGLKIDEDIIDDIYTFGLKNKHFTYGFNLQNFISAAIEFLKKKSNKIQVKII